MVYIAPSILAADACRLSDEVLKASRSGADFIHCDIMDGHFVPNISFGPHVVAAVKKCSPLPVEAHLMISEPDRYAAAFIDAGADIISVHCETPEKSRKAADLIRNAGRMLGLVVNPPTPFESIQALFDLRPELVLCMTVNPGFGGQEFIHDVLPKIRAVRESLNPTYLSVDGGLNTNTIALAARAGANFIVAGTAVFRAQDPVSAVKELRMAASQA
ncbi:MAG: ribulose-phosphate 3-epimerase [Planctomycetes bacterium]|nr:ribulose-phosphate 3-epimerase [Planctomycetota bacterium]